MSNEKKDDLYFTKLFDKCSNKEKESGEFEECCKKEATNPLLNTAERVLKDLIHEDIPKEDIMTKAHKIINKGFNKKLDEFEAIIDNDR